MNNTKKLSESLEDYLETIAFLSAENGSARLTDIAKAMSVKKPSATEALYALAQRGLIEYDKYRPVVLTKAGKEYAQNVSGKHKLLSDFFTGVLGVDPENADLTACKMEHALEDSIMQKLVNFLKSADMNSCSVCPTARNKCALLCPHVTTLAEVSVGERVIILEIEENLKNILQSTSKLAIGETLDVLKKRKNKSLEVLVHNTATTISFEHLSKVKVKRI